MIAGVVAHLLCSLTRTARKNTKCCTADNKVTTKLPLNGRTNGVKDKDNLEKFRTESRSEQKRKFKKFSSFLNWWSFFIWICKVCLCRSLLKQNLSLMSEQSSYMGTKPKNYVSSKYFILLIFSFHQTYIQLCAPHTQTWTPDSSNTPFIGFPTNGFILQLNYLLFLFHPSHTFIPVFPEMFKFTFLSPQIPLTFR